MSTGKSIVQLSQTNQVNALQSYASDAAYEAANGAGAAGDMYHNTTENVVRWHNGTAWQTVWHVPIRPGIYGLGLEAAQTSVAADSIRLTGYDGADLSSDAHHGYAVLPHATTPGALSVFRVSANITLKQTGAHWGFGGQGDRTDQKFADYLVNDNGTLRLGTMIKQDVKTIASTSTSATPTDINLYTEMLVDTALSVGTWPCLMIGGHLADFDDTGGSSEDLWAIQTAIGEIWTGIPFPVVGGLELLSDQTVSAVSAVDFTKFASELYDAYLIQFCDLVPGTDNTDLWLKYSTDGGSNFIAANYRHARYSSVEGAAVVVGGSASDSKILIFAGLGSSTGESASGFLKLGSPSGSLYKLMTGELTSYSASPALTRTTFGGTYTGAATAINALRIEMSSGTISGKFKLYGVRKS